MATRVIPEKRWREKDLVQMLNMSRRTIRRKLEGLPGVELIGHPGDRKRKKYQMMLVPDSVLAAEIAKWRKH